MINAINNIKKAREIIARDLLKGSDDYKTGAQACDEAIMELKPVVCEYCDPTNRKPFAFDFDDDTDIDYTSWVEDNKIITDRIDNEWMDWERFKATVNYCPMCGRKLDEVEQ